MQDKYLYIYKELKKKLALKGIRTTLITRSTNGSLYVKFNVEGLGKLRISDHKEVRKYAYRWQLRVDANKKKTIRKKNHNQYLYPINDLDRLVTHLVNYSRVINKNNNKIFC